MSFVNLHSHSYYSLLDGFSSPDELIKRAAELEMPAMAITDHGNLTAHRETYRAGKENGVKPILGVEAYFTKDMYDRTPRKDRGPDDKAYNHIILIAKNDVGLKNIGRMSELAWKDGFYYKPRMDHNLLEEYHEGVIVVSGCMNSIICQAILNGKDEYAIEQAQWFKNIFGDDFYIEIQPHNSLDLNVKSLSLADQLGIKPVLTLDCHYASPDQRTAEEIMLAIGTHPKAVKDTTQSKARSISNVMDKLDYLYGDRQMSFKDINLYLMSRQEAYEQMEAQGILREDMFENTLEVASKVSDYELPKSLELLPSTSKDPASELVKLANEGLKERGLSDKPDYVNRLNEELEIIQQKDFSAYFLIVADMISHAKSQGIMVGPGRGSSAGSLVCYALGITEIDPIEYGLLFFRFIDLERDDFPDIDTDIEDRRRNEVKEYIGNKYGNVASIATYNTFKDKNAIKDVARIFGVPYADINNVLKGVDDWSEIHKSAKGKRFITDYPEVMKYADSLRGRIRSTGIHPAGIVTSSIPINEVAPIEYRKDPKTGEQIPVVALDMNEAADIGLIKIDALGLKTLSVISEALELIKSRKRKKIDLLEIPLNDSLIYEELSNGRTKGIFQVEQAAYTSLLVKMGVDNFSDLAASNALVRPGAMNSIGAEYIARKHGKRDISFIHKDVIPYTSETYGLHVYQEQVMLTCIEIGGMSKGDANKVRKIIGKKKDVREFDAYKAMFIEGASKKISEKEAESLWHEFEAHADYSFNKSHAVAYSMLTYWTAWLKYYYPHEFILATLNNEGDKDSKMEYLIEAKRMGIKIALPHINYSESDFSLQGDKLRFGLNSIKFISDKVAQNIIEGRPYLTYSEFSERANKKFSGINSRAVNALNMIGAATFDDNPKSGDERKNLYEIIGLPEFSSEIPDWVSLRFNSSEDFTEDGQYIIFGMVKNIKRGKGWSRVEIVDKLGTIGVFDEENTPLEPGAVYVFSIAKNSIISYSTAKDIVEERNPLGKFLMSPKPMCDPDTRYIIGVRTRETKSKTKMATVLFCDDVGDLDSALVFSYNFEDVMRKASAGRKVSPVFSRTKDGTLTIKEIKNGI